MRSQFSELWIPTAVVRELARHPDPSARFAIETAISDRWIKPAAVQPSALLDVFRSSLHQGEAEAIALASILDAEIIIIDEQEGRQIATQAGLSVTGVLGILLRAKHTGAIPHIRPEIRALRANARFFIAPSLEAKILLAAGE